MGITSLSDMLHGQEQGWKWESISFELPPRVKDKIRAIPRHYLGGGEDTIMWKYSRDGEFSTKSAYVLANTPPET